MGRTSDARSSSGCRIIVVVFAISMDDWWCVSSAVHHGFYAVADVVRFQVEYAVKCDGSVRITKVTLSNSVNGSYMCITF